MVDSVTVVCPICQQTRFFCVPDRPYGRDLVCSHCVAYEREAVTWWRAGFNAAIDGISPVKNV